MRRVTKAEPRRRALNTRHTARGGRIARVAAVVVASALAHARFLGAPQIRATTSPRRSCSRARGYAARAAPLVKRVGVAIDRAALIARGREARRQGHLALGEFLLDANAVDAREQGVGFDRARAGALYAARIEALRAAATKVPLRAAVPAAFGDLHYFGRPGGGSATR